MVTLQMTSINGATANMSFASSHIQILPDGETGRVAFDAMGDRINAEYRVVNVQRKGDSREVGTYNFSKVRLSDSNFWSIDTVQGDASGCSPGLVDIKAKVAF